MSERILQVCKELIDDAKMGSVDLVFKEVCLEILSRARQVLTESQFRQLVDYVGEKMKDRMPTELQQELTANR